MSWTTPKTWVANEILTAAELNEQLRDNLTHLEQKPGAFWTGSLTDTVTGTTSYVTLDSTNLAHTITLDGSSNLRVLVGWRGRSGISAGAGSLAFRVGGTDYEVERDDSTGQYAAAITTILGGLSAGSLTVSLRGKVENASHTLTVVSSAFFVVQL